MQIVCVRVCVCVCVHVCVHVCVCILKSRTDTWSKNTDFEETDFPETKSLKRYRVRAGNQGIQNHEHPRVQNGLNSKIAWVEAERRVYGELLDIFTR